MTGTGGRDEDLGHRTGVLVDTLKACLRACSMLARRGAEGVDISCILSMCGRLAIMGRVLQCVLWLVVNKQVLKRVESRRETRFIVEFLTTVDGGNLEPFDVAVAVRGGRGLVLMCGYGVKHCTGGALSVT